jgi:hypothetical protein
MSVSTAPRTSDEKDETLPTTAPPAPLCRAPGRLVGVEDERETNRAAREYPDVPFERYADDGVVHCDSERQAREVLAAIANRLEHVGLRLHPDKTTVVYCKDGDRRGSYEHTSFTFVGFTFRARKARNKAGKNFTNFLPAISKDALNKISGEVRRWRLHRRTRHSFAELARKINPIVRGWIQYYGASTAPRCIPSCNASTPTWCAGSARSTSGCGPSRRPSRAGNASPASTPGSSPTGHGSTPPGDQDDRSRMTGDCHVRIRGSPGVRFPQATRP